MPAMIAISRISKTHFMRAPFVPTERQLPLTGRCGQGFQRCRRIWAILLTGGTNTEPDQRQPTPAHRQFSATTGDARRRGIEDGSLGVTTRVRIARAVRCARRSRRRVAGRSGSTSPAGGSPIPGWLICASGRIEYVATQRLERRSQNRQTPLCAQARYFSLSGVNADANRGGRAEIASCVHALPTL